MISNDFNKAQANLLTSIQQLIQDVLDVGEDEAQSKVPKDTGELSDSIHSKMTSELSGQLSAGEGISDIRAIANEYGTSRMRATPYMMPAFEAMESEVQVVNEFKLI